MRHRISVALLAALAASATAADPSPYAGWSHGPSTDPAYFPIGVWLQSPGNAVAYKNAGVNLFVGLWEGPTEAQLTALKNAGMQTICEQNAVGIAHKDDSTIVGWMHGDEPDNAQADGSGGYGPPILPSVIQAGYATIRANDATRPVYLNLGQGLAYHDYIGRGTRHGHDEDYPEYLSGCDIGSFDIYPVNSPYPAVVGKLEYVPLGISNLIAWSGGKPSWCWIETTRIGSDSPRAPTPAEVRSEVWMALIAGARGFGYFCHEFDPFIEGAWLGRPPMRDAITAIDHRVAALAPALNSATLPGVFTTASSNAAVPIATMVKRVGGVTWLFACAMRGGTTTGTFSSSLGGAAIAVLDEDRTLRLNAGAFTDTFTGYAVHLYQITPDAGGTTTGGTTTGGTTTSGTTTGGTTGGTTGSGTDGGHSSHRGCGGGAGGAMAAAGVALMLARRPRRS